MHASIRKALGALALLVASSLPGDQAHGFEQDDYYLLAVSWVPSWCATEGDARNAPQCDTNAGWQVHGLWPQYANGGWPAYCETDARDPSRAQTRAMRDIMGDGGLAWHQWKKHGRCSGLGARAYFAKTRRAFAGLKWPDALQDIARTTRTTPDAVEAVFRSVNPAFMQDGMITTCRDGNLQELRLCLTRDLHPRRCGADVLAQTCRARQVILPSQR